MTIRLVDRKCSEWEGEHHESKTKRLRMWKKLLKNFLRKLSENTDKSIEELLIAY